MSTSGFGASTGVTVDILTDSDLWTAHPQSAATVRRAIAAAATATPECCPAAAEVAVALIDDTAIQELNRQWRGRDAPTNVLSFPADTRNMPDGAPILLGDIAIAFETLAREAAAETKTFDDHLAHLTTHGFLHLLGFDHENDADAEIMEALEREILARLGVADPYAPEASQITPPPC